MLMKMVALGVVLHKRSYLRDGWNVFDFLVVSSSIISVALTAFDIDIALVRVLRVFRVLRPLRTIQRVPKLKEVVVCFIASVSNIAGIALLFFLCLFLFSVMGVQLFKGTFYSCTDPAATTSQACTGNFSVPNQLTGLPQLVPREWQDSDFNYNNVGEALNTLFASATGEGWPATLYRSIDASTTEFEAPVYNNRPAVGLLYIVYMVVVSFFMLNIFIGFVIITFRDTIEDSYAACPMNKNQRKCMEYVVQRRPVRVYRWRNPVAPVRWLHHVVCSKAFELIIYAIIVLNVVALMLPYYQMPQRYAQMSIMFCQPPSLLPLPSCPPFPNKFTAPYCRPTSRDWPLLCAPSSNQSANLARNTAAWMRCSYEDILEYVNLGFVGVATLAVTQMAFTACALHRLPRIRDTRRMCYVSTAHCCCPALPPAPGSPMQHILSAV